MEGTINNNLNGNGTAIPPCVHYQDPKVLITGSNFVLDALRSVLIQSKVILIVEGTNWRRWPSHNRIHRYRHRHIHRPIPIEINPQTIVRRHQTIHIQSLFLGYLCGGNFDKLHISSRNRHNISNRVGKVLGVYAAVFAEQLQGTLALASGQTGVGDCRTVVGTGSAN